MSVGAAHEVPVFNTRCHSQDRSRLKVYFPDIAFHKKEIFIHLKWFTSFDLVTSSFCLQHMYYFSTNNVSINNPTFKHSSVPSVWHFQMPANGDILVQLGSYHSVLSLQNLTQVWNRFEVIFADNCSPLISTKTGLQCVRFQIFFDVWLNVCTKCVV